MTFGWIKEGDEERFYEAQAARPAKRSPPPTYDCPYCQQTLADYRAFNEHLRTTHTSPRPFLLLKGREPGGKDVVRQALAPEDVKVIGASEIEVSVDQGPRRPVSVTRLAQLFGACGSRTLDIRLSPLPEWGPKATQPYPLRVRIASDAELRKADETFVRLFGRGDAHLLSLDPLRAEAGGGAADYVGALCNYVHGVLAKDRAPGTGVGPPWPDWSESYKASLQVLAATPRPLAALLSGLMRFALNDFSHWREATGFPLLDAASSTLGPLTDGAAAPRVRRPTMGRKRVTVCPVDAGVHRVMEETYRFSGLKRWSEIDERAARDLASSDPLGAFDRAKAQAIWALTAFRLGAREAAAEPLRRLLNNDGFGGWAKARLAEIDP